MTQLGRSRSLIEIVAERLRGVFEGARVETGPPRRAAIIGHRGAPRRAPENTITGARRAIADGADGIEVDVCVTKDGHAVLWHGSDPDGRAELADKLRATGDGYVRRLPARGSPMRRRVSELELSEFLSTHGYERIASALREAFGAETDALVRPDLLADLLAWFAGESGASWLFIDVKLSPDERHYAEAITSELATAFSRTPALVERRIFVLTTEREVFFSLQQRLARHPELKSCALTADFERPSVVRTAREIGARNVSVGLTMMRSFEAVKKELERAVSARERGELDSVLVWTLDEAHELRDAFALGVDAVLTNDVVEARRVRDEITQRRFSVAGASAHEAELRMTTRTP